MAALTDRESALQQIARLSVPFFADWCVVYCINQHGNIEPVATAHRDPEREQTLRDVLQSYPLDWNSAAITVRALRTAKSQLFAELPEAFVASFARDDHAARIVERLNPRSVISVPLVIRERTMGVMTFVTAESQRNYDASDAQFAEDLAERAATAIDNAQLFHAVQMAVKQKDEFLAMLADELRSPLAAITYATALANMPSTEPKTEIFEIIERQVGNLKHLIDDLLDVARISRDKIKLQLEQVNASVIANRAAATVRPLMEQKKHEFLIEMAEEPLPLLADPTRAEQIMANLLTNAAKYTADGGTVTLRVLRDDGCAVIKVKDTGVGLPPEMLTRVFELFAQADRTIDRSEGGLGIGLTVVRKLAEMHGGSVSAASEGVGKGSEFTVRLPLSEMPVAPANDVAERPRKSHARLRMLVVDDNRDTVMSSVLWLKALGHEVRDAYDGNAAHPGGTRVQTASRAARSRPAGHERLCRRPNSPQGRLHRPADRRLRLWPARGSKAFAGRRLRQPPGQTGRSSTAGSGVGSRATGGRRRDRLLRANSGASAFSLAIAPLARDEKFAPAREKRLAAKKNAEDRT